MSQFIPSPEQQAIFDAVMNTSGNIAIAAGAGAGKTSTLVWIAKHLPTSASKIFCAFNADIVKELEAKLTGTGVTARTFHSLGLASLKKYLNAIELKPKDTKYRDLVNKWAESDGVLSLTLSEAIQSYKAEERADKLYQLRKDTLTLFVNLLNLARVKLVEWNDVAGLTRLVYMNRLDVEVPHEELVDLVIRNVEYIMKQAEAETRKHNIDFTDMIYWAVRWNLNLYPYKYVLVDEAQDFNPMQREMIAKIIDPKGGRIILVGDPNQAIYAFAGADSDSFDLSVKRWNCTVLPLNTTRRCSSVITQHASRLVPTFTCPPDKPRGKLVWLDESAFESSVQLGDMVVSRVQAPLVKYCLLLIAKGIPSVIKGKDMSKGFIALLDKLAKRRDYSFANLLKCLANYETEQVDIATKKNDDVAIETIRDQCSGLRFFIEAYPDVASITDLENKIKNLFGDSKPNSDVVTFCTVHKSKGLEADRVFILAPDKMPLKSKDMTSEQLQQEWNLLYVAETRAKSVLVVMTNPKFLKTNSMPHYAQEDFEEHNWDAPLVADVEAEPVIEADSVPAYPSFATHFQEIISLMGTTNVLYATNNGVKLCVSRIALGITALNITTLSAEGESIHTAEMPEAIDLMQAFEPNLNHWMSVSVDEWESMRNPAPVVDAVFKSDGMFIEAFSTPDDVPVTFTVQITELIHALPPNSGLFAVDGDTKMFVAPHIMEKGKYFVETVNGAYTQEIMTLDEALAKMEAFSPVVPTWNELTCDHWMHATSTQKTVAERRAEKLAETTANPVTEPDAPQPESAGFTDSDIHKALELLTPNEGMYATANSAKMFVNPLENRYVVKTIFINGDDNNPMDTIQEALALMFEFQPDHKQWIVISLDEWAEKVNPTPLVEPPSFAKTMHTRLNALTQDYTPDTGLFADGEKTTMYITTDIEDNFVVYERDYANEPEMAWSRDYKTTNIVMLISKMQAIHPDATQWTMTSWSQWIDRFHEEDESADMDALKTEFVDAIRDMVTQMGGVIAGESTSVTLGDQTYELVQMPSDSADAPQPETPNADALTVSMIAKIIETGVNKPKEKIHLLAYQIHEQVSSIITFTDWNKSNRARVKVAIKHILRKANYAHDMFIESFADKIADFYQSGEIPASGIIELITKAEESGTVVDAIIQPSFADVMKPRIRPLTPAVPSSAIGLASNGANSTVFVYIGSDETIVLTEKIHATGEHFVIPSNLDPILSKMERYNPNPDEWVSMSWNDWYKSSHSEPTDTPIEAPQPVAGVVTTPVTPPADDTTFSNGESTPTYTNGKDHSASTTPTPAPLPTTAPDVLKSLIDQFRPLELTEITLMIQALEHVRKEKTEGVSV